MLTRRIGAASTDSCWHTHESVVLIRCTILSFLVSILLSQPIEAMDASPQKAYLSKDEIRQGVESIISTIQDLSVEFTFNTVGKVPQSYWGARTHVIAVVKGGKCYIKRECLPAAEYGDRGDVREVAYNGRESTVHFMAMGRAGIDVGRDRDTNTKGLGFFDMMLLNAAQPNGRGFDDQSLISLTKYEHSRVRPFLEIVDGRPCHVVDAFRPAISKPVLSVWLDCEHGFLPLRQQYYGGPASGELVMSFHVEHAIPFTGGLWLATSGRKQVPAMTLGAKEPQFALEHVLEVKGWRDGAAAITVNSGVSDDFFDLWKRLPPGSLVDDYANKKRWTVAGNDFRAVADAAESTLGREPLAIPEKGTVGSSTGQEGKGSASAVANETTRRSAFVKWSVAVVVSGAALLAVWILVRKRDRRRASGGMLLLLMPIVFFGTSSAQTTTIASDASPGQSTLACGPASLAAAFRLLGVDISNVELMSLVDARGNTSFALMEEFARSRGLYTACVRLPPQDLLKLNHLAILQVYPYAAQRAAGQERHFVLYAGPAPQPKRSSAVDDAASEHVYIFDPIAGYGPRGAFELDELAEFYTGNALILSKFPIQLSKSDGASAGARSLWLRNAIGTGGAALVLIAIVIASRRCLKARANRSGAARLIILASYIGIGSGIAWADQPLGPAVPAQRYVVGTPVHDAGMISSGETVRHEFVLHNPDQHPISLRLDAKGCQCTEAKILGSGELAPGDETKVAIAVLTRAGGKLTQGVRLHIAGQKDPIYLAIAASVVDNTIIEPVSVDFGEVVLSTGKYERPLRLVHYGREGEEPFSVKSVEKQAKFLSLDIGESKATRTGAGALMYEQQLTVTVDSTGCAPGLFTDALTLQARAAGKALSFKVPCSGQILSPVQPRPNGIIRIGRGLAEDWECDLSLQSHVPGRLEVEAIDGNDLKILGWSAKPYELGKPLVLHLRLHSTFSNGRSTGACVIRVREPLKMEVRVPVRLVDLAR